MSQYQRNYLADSMGINPTVRPIDTFVQASQAGVAGAPIGPNPATQIAAALGQANQALEQYYFQPAHQKMLRQQEVDAQTYKDQYENMQAFSDAVKRGDIEHGDNPWLQVYTKELFAKEEANEVSIRIAELTDRQDILGAEDPIAAFNEAVQEIHTEVLGDNSDPYFRQAFSRHSAPMIARGANQFAQGLRRFNVEEAERAFQSNLGTELEKVFGELETGDVLTQEGLSQSISDALGSLRESNLIPAHRINEMAAGALLAKAEEYSTTDGLAAESVLKALESMKNKDGAYISNIPQISLRIAKLRDKIDTERERRDDKDYTARKRAQDEALDVAVGFVAELDRTLTGPEVREILEKEHPGITNRAVEALVKDHVSGQRADKAYGDASLGKAVDLEINDLFDLYDTAVTPEERQLRLTQILDFKNETDLSVSQHRRMSDFIYVTTNAEAKKAGRTLTPFVALESAAVLQAYTVESETEIGKFALKPDGKAIKSMIDVYATNALAERMRDRELGPPTQEELQEIARNSVAQAEEFVKAQKESGGLGLSPEVEEIPVSPFEVGRQEGTDKASETYRNIQKLEQDKASATTLAERERIQKNIDSQTRLEEKQVRDMQIAVAQHLQVGFKSGWDGTAVGGFVSMGSREEAQKNLVIVSTTRDGGPQFARRILSEYHEVSQKHPDLYPPNGVVDPLVVQLVESPGTWAHIVGEFQEILKDPESITRTQGRYNTPERDPNNILWLLHQANPGWGLGAFDADGKSTSEMFKSIEVAQVRLATRAPQPVNKENK